MARLTRSEQKLLDRVDKLIAEALQLVNDVTAAHEDDEDNEVHETLLDVGGGLSDAYHALQRL